MQALSALLPLCDCTRGINELIWLISMIRRVVYARHCIKQGSYVQLQCVNISSEFLKSS